jgi:hypothetical protein
MTIATGSGATSTAANTAVASTADCGASKVVSGGGYRVSTFAGAGDWDVEQYPSDASGNLDATGTARYWTARFIRATSTTDRTITAYAFCVNP